MRKTKLTPNQVARILEVGIHTVLKLIAEGEIEATNVGASSTPRWKIEPSAVQSFLERRTNVPPIVGVRRKQEPSTLNTKRIIG